MIAGTYDYSLNRRAQFVDAAASSFVCPCASFLLNNPVRVEIRSGLLTREKGFGPFGLRSLKVLI